MTVEEYLETFSKKNTYQEQYFRVLQDGNWHCRNCSLQDVPSSQLAGGGGVQGLQRGTKSRPGLHIESETRTCDQCNITGKWDHWNGTFIEPHPPSGISKKLEKRIMKYYKYIDSIEQRERNPENLVVDHRFPMIRWGTAEDENSSSMSEDEIRKKFQLLKKDESGNHNLLKSRACEQCLANKKRGYPLGIQYYYEGSEIWPQGCPEKSPEAEKGCIGCGWYNMQEWRDSLNNYIKKETQSTQIPGERSAFP